MFTGIIELSGTVVAVKDTDNGKRITVDIGGLNYSAKHGESISIDGTCLTVNSLHDQGVVFDVVPETLSKTILDEVKEGDHVNVERSLKADQRITGHYVLGHVDGVTEVVERIEDDNGLVLWFNLSPELKEYVVERASVAINGVSLTVATLKDDRFSVALIPTTRNVTNLDNLQQGSRVNIEVDIIAKQVARWLTLHHKQQ